MAEYAVKALGVPQSCVVLELESSNTWDNVRLALPLAAESEWIAFASDPLHARRAARYVALQFPELASRVVGADDYRPFEKLGLKSATGLYEAFVAVRDWQFRRRDRRGRR